jgi:GTP pyrophosphokinase
MRQPSEMAIAHPGVDLSAGIDPILSRMDANAQALLRQVYSYVHAPLNDLQARSGEPIWARIKALVETVMLLGLDQEAVAVIFLLPLLRAKPQSAAGMRLALGDSLVALTEGVLRMGEIGGLTKKAIANTTLSSPEAQLESLRKMLLAMVQDIRVVLIKLADHLQDLRVAVKSNLPQLMVAHAELARDIFAPLANRLGVWHIKWELEDMSLRVLAPQSYQKIARYLDEKRQDREQYIVRVINQLKTEIFAAGITAEVTGRPKHIASIHRKMQNKAIDFESLYDVRAVRVIVRDVKDCYAVLGIVHSLWSPLPKEFDDYIAKPKPNNYRSLHTALIGPENKSIEVQIRTDEMHHHSELGVAAHWKYKEGGRQDRGYQEKISWLRQVLEWKDEVKDTSEFADQFRSGLFDESVYVLTPQGQVIDLPKGSTPIDFAYHVHSELGHRCRGAKVDGLMVPLNTQLVNAQQVEILTAKQGHPSRDWLNVQLGFLKSASARTKVRQWFNRQNVEMDLAQGRTILDKELQRHGQTKTNLEQLAVTMGCDHLNDLLMALARGEINQKTLRDTLVGVEARAPESAVPRTLIRKPNATTGGILIVGVDKLLTATAKCCRPAPPEPIIGFVTRGRGVTVHRAQCSSISRLDPDRLITAQWGDASTKTFPIEIVVDAVDRTGLLRDIGEVLTRERINVTATRSISSDLSARMRFTVEVRHLDQLQAVMSHIREVNGVIDVCRR